VIKKSQLLTLSVMATLTGQLAGTSGAVSFQDMVDTTVHHMLIKQSRVLVKMLVNLI
jgi:hypothetical protein